MLIAQISDTHVMPDGRLMSGRVDTAPYLARAVAPGKYVHPPATVEDMYRPERFGRTGFGSAEVVARP